MENRIINEFLYFIIIFDFQNINLFTKYNPIKCK